MLLHTLHALYNRIKRLLAIVGLSACLCSIAFPLWGEEEGAPPIKGLHDLQGRTVGVDTSTDSERHIRESFGSDIKVISYTSIQQLRDALRSGLIEAIVTDEGVARRILSGADDIVMLEEKLIDKSFRVAVRVGNSELMTIVNDTIESMKSNDVFRHLEESYMPKPGISPKPVPKVPTVPNATKTLRVGLCADYPPFEYISNRHLTGFDVSLCDYIAREYGAKLVLVDMAYDQLVPALISERIDIAVSGIEPQDEIWRRIAFSDPYWISSEVVLTLKH